MTPLSARTRTALRGALPTWLASRAAVAVLSVAGAWMAGGGKAGEVPSFLRLWDRWDVGLFVKIARDGYFGDPEHYPDCCTEAFFPGGPLVLRAVHVVVPSWIAAGLLVSLVAGAVAATALWRLAALEGGPLAGGRAVLYLVVAPYAVFLFAGYSEALFLAFAVPAWLAAREGRWRAAGLLAAGAALVRVTGVFLALGLVVEYVVAKRRAARPVPEGDAAWLLAPFAAVSAYVVWLHGKTGDWLAWQHAQERGWGRRLTSPWRAWDTTWGLARDGGAGSEYAWAFRAEIVAVLLGVALVVVLARSRRWGEATFIGLNLVVLATSTYYLSVTRAALTWFPLYLLLARVSLRRPWVHPALLWASAPLMAVAVVAFTSGRWVG